MRSVVKRVWAAVSEESKIDVESSRVADSVRHV
jgi:hypothetical protein